jgi:hypothetical protein
VLPQGAQVSQTRRAGSAAGSSCIADVVRVEHRVTTTVALNDPVVRVPVDGVERVARRAEFWALLWCPDHFVAHQRIPASVSCW